MDDMQQWGELFEKSQRKTVVMNQTGEKVILDTDNIGGRPVLGKIVILSQQIVETQFYPDKTWAGISIMDQRPFAMGKEVKITEENQHDLLRLGFDDLTMPMPEREAFTSQQAREVWKFVVKNWHEVDLFMIHCHAGISRSAGIGKAISAIFQPKWFEYFDQFFIPNRLVYGKMLDEAADIVIGRA